MDEPRTPPVSPVLGGEPLRRRAVRPASVAGSEAHDVVDGGTRRWHGEGEAAFDDFYRRELPRLLALARALVGSAYAEDVAQESLLVVYGRWRSVSAMASPVGYARGICLNKAVSVVRRRALERRLLGRLASTAGPGTSSLPENSERFWRQVRSLPRRQAQVIALHYALDMSVADIADVLDCAEGTVKAHLHRARTSLAATLDLDSEDER